MFSLPSLLDFDLFHFNEMISFQSHSARIDTYLGVGGGGFPTQGPLGEAHVAGETYTKQQVTGLPPRLPPPIPPSTSLYILYIYIYNIYIYI